MGDITFTVLDQNTGKPIQDAQVIADVVTQGCAWDNLGCSSGSPYSLSGYTNSKGQIAFSLLYNNAQTVSYTVQANGYNEQSGTMSIGGGNILSENVWGVKTVQMTAQTTSSPPPGQGVGNLLNNPTLTADVQDVSSFLTGLGIIGSIEGTIVIVFISIAIVIVAILLIALRV